MAQKGWIWNKKRVSHDDLMAYAATYPLDFPYTPDMLDQMFEHHQRKYISPTMLSSCPRQQVLKRELDYWEYPDHAWTRYRGTIAHLMMEKGRNEPDAVLEQSIEVLLRIPGYAPVVIKGTPDKVIPSQELLIDYKTITELVDPATQKGKDKIAGWTTQLSCYRWMLAQTGVIVNRAFIQEISLKAPARIEIPLWSLEDTEAYIAERVIRFIGVLDGTYDLENLPPMLDPLLDADSVWLCHSSWCPVAYQCKQLQAAAQAQADMEPIFD